MLRSLTPKESQVFDKFNSKVKLTPINAKILSLIKDNNNFIIQEPLIYHVEDTDSYLIFGELVSGYQLDKVKKHIEQLTKKQPYDTLNENINTESIVNSIEESEVVNHGNEEVAMTGSSKLYNNGQLREEDIKMLVDQFNITREEAIDVLANNNYDTVEAMMHLHEK